MSAGERSRATSEIDKSNTEINIIRPEYIMLIA